MVDEESLKINEQQLPFIYQLISAEDHVYDEYQLIENEIEKLLSDEKRVRIERRGQKGLFFQLVIWFVVFFVLFANFGLIGFFMSLAILGGLLVWRKKKKEVYEEKIATITSAVNEYQVSKNKISQKLTQILNENEVYTSKIPEIFRDQQSIAELYSIIQTGQADNLKEAYSILEARYRHEEEMGVLRANAKAVSRSNQLAQNQLNEMKLQSDLQNQQLGQLQDLHLEAQQIRESAKSTDARMAGIEETFVPRHKRKN
ncbi:hypothetical protein RD055328_00350 [Companilactobacillus sp. RD055328]|uniref:hypothetical protein n=1 Tax=Companilactobacillus sp. RD055328 TaxID=2916634 RepID=UPI001FC8BB0B|nr:hypothetical protein [Companilactobacillus sp. RD055328]GKQ42112.1 hypothetical protein RD055328_00350 [Companilactobacillus sp. RD055328]